MKGEEKIKRRTRSEKAQIRERIKKQYADAGNLTYTKAEKIRVRSKPKAGKPDVSLRVVTKSVPYKGTSVQRNTNYKSTGSKKGRFKR